MLIKKLIQRLLDSRTTPSEAVVANRANNTGTNIAPLNTVTSSGGWTTILSAWAAPNDGYIKIFGNIVKLDGVICNNWYSSSRVFFRPSHRFFSTRFSTIEKRRIGDHYGG